MWKAFPRGRFDLSSNETITKYLFLAGLGLNGDFLFYNNTTKVKP